MLERILEQLNQLVDKIVLLMDRFPDGFWDQGLEAVESGTAGLLDTLAMLKELVVSILRWMELTEWALNGVLDLFLHFVWSSVAGVLAFYLTYWTTHMLFFLGARLLRLPLSPPDRVVRGMVGFGWSAALFAAFSAHMWWDRLLSFG